jgi:CelD/BcsL family acetyltransferase involved in cellulose biosynthesis
VHGTIHTAFRVEWRPINALESDAAEWRMLAGRAVEPNVFYEPSFVLSAAGIFGCNVGAGLVWSRTAPERLLGMFPARIECRRYGLALPLLVGWTHPYAPLGTPLVDPGCSEAVIAAWVDHIERDPRLPKLMLLPYLPAHGPLAGAINALIARRGGRSAMFARHARALLVVGSTRENYLEQSVDRKKRKELRRQRNRLAESGSLSTDVASTPEAAAAAMSDFFSLEARGWKGLAGTAARCDGEIAGFVGGAVIALAGEGKARVVRLCVGGQAVAALVILRSGTSAWCWKIAYDEDYARFSPGVQIVLDATRVLLGDAGLERTDSCATPDHPMIDHIWRERLPLCDRLISFGRGSALKFELACRLEGAQRAGFQIAKAARDLLRPR